MDIYLDGIFKTMLKHQRLQCKSWFLTAKPCKTFELQREATGLAKLADCGDIKQNNAIPVELSLKKTFAPLPLICVIAPISFKHLSIQ